MRLFKQQEPPPPEVLEAYQKAKQERRIENAKAAGIRDADNIANQKPFYKKLLNAGQAIVNDLSAGPPPDMFQLPNDDYLLPDFDYEPKRKKRKKRNRHRR